MAYAVGHVSGGHFNPAVSIGCAAGGRLPWRDRPAYIVTDSRAPKGFAPLAIGLSLTLIHLIAIPVSNTSVNPARSTGPALFAGADPMSQLWVFWLAPVIGALVAGFTYSLLLGREAPATSLEEAEEA